VNIMGKLISGLAATALLVVIAIPSTSDAATPKKAAKAHRHSVSLASPRECFRGMSGGIFCRVNAPDPCLGLEPNCNR
jgi:hypothetical protein